MILRMMTLMILRMFLKVDGFGNILFCCHGLKFLKSEEIAQKYPNKFLQVRQPTVHIVIQQTDRLFPSLTRSGSMCTTPCSTCLRSTCWPVWSTTSRTTRATRSELGEHVFYLLLSLFFDTYLKTPFLMTCCPQGEGRFHGGRPPHVLQVRLPGRPRVGGLRPHGGGHQHPCLGASNVSG